MGEQSTTWWELTLQICHQQLFRQVHSKAKHDHSILSWKLKMESWKTDKNLSTSAGMTIQNWLVGYIGVGSFLKVAFEFLSTCDLMIFSNMLFKLHEKVFHDKKHKILLVPNSNAISEKILSLCLYRQLLTSILPKFYVKICTTFIDFKFFSCWSCCSNIWTFTILFLILFASRGRYI